MKTEQSILSAFYRRSEKEYQDAGRRLRRKLKKKKIPQRIKRGPREKWQQKHSLRDGKRCTESWKQKARDSRRQAEEHDRARTVKSLSLDQAEPEKSLCGEFVPRETKSSLNSICLLRGSLAKFITKTYLVSKDLFSFQKGQAVLGREGLNMMFMGPDKQSFRLLTNVISFFYDLENVSDSSVSSSQTLSVADEAWKSGLEWVKS